MIDMTKQPPLRIENWSVVDSFPDDIYTAPEARCYSLVGTVKGHPHLGDGEVHTSTIKTVRGRVVTTYSGSKYRLGQPSPMYVAWCEKSGCHVPTWKVPIKVVRCEH